MEDVIEKLIYKKILEIESLPNNSYLNILDIIMDFVKNVYDCKICTLWKVNKRTKTVSSVRRLSHDTLKHYCMENDEEIIYHPIKDSCIGECLNIIKKDCLHHLYINDIKANEAIYEKHRCKKNIEELGLKDFILIPITLIKSYETQYCDFVITMYPANYKEDIISHLRDFIETSLRIYFNKKECAISEELKKSNGNINVIIEILQKYLKCEGCSIFAFDKISARLKCIGSSGLKQKESNIAYSFEHDTHITPSFFFQNTEKIFISDNFQEEKKQYRGGENIICSEKTTHRAKTLLLVKIEKLSTEKDSAENIGLIRFVNRLPNDSNTIIEFDEYDIDILNSISLFISLYIQQLLVEEEMLAYSKQLVHELRSPIVAIQSTASRFLQKKNEEDDFKYVFMHLDSQLEDIITCCGILSTEVNRINYLWSENHILESKRNDARLEDLFWEAKKMAIPVARNQNLSFDNIKYVGEKPSIYVERERFKQIFYNLISNAIKYRDDDKDFSIVFQCETVEDSLLLRIIDNGIGIASKDVKTIFEFGFRSKKACTIDTGLGVGLSVVKKNLELYGCKIEVERREHPTIFLVTMPLGLIR